MNNKKEFTDMRAAISLALNALDRDGTPVRKEMADELRKAFGNFIEASERATEAGTPGTGTTASAAGTIDTEALWGLVVECHSGYQYGPASRSDRAKAALVRHIDQWGEARAEEAGREARKQAEEYLASIHVEGM